jgi:hypothetical protein
MSDSERDQKFDLECSRLASDLNQLASVTLNADLKAYCLRMARLLNDQVETKRGP